MVGARLATPNIGGVPVLSGGVLSYRMYVNKTQLNVVPVHAMSIGLIIY